MYNVGMQDKIYIIILVLKYNVIPAKAEIPDMLYVNATKIGKTYNHTVIIHRCECECECECKCECKSKCGK